MAGTQHPPTYIVVQENNFCAVGSIVQMVYTDLPDDYFDTRRGSDLITVKLVFGNTTGYWKNQWGENDVTCPMYKYELKPYAQEDSRGI